MIRTGRSFQAREKMARELGEVLEDMRSSSVGGDRRSLPRKQRDIKNP